MDSQNIQGDALIRAVLLYHLNNCLNITFSLNQKIMNIPVLFFFSRAEKNCLYPKLFYVFFSDFRKKTKSCARGDRFESL